MGKNKQLGVVLLTFVTLMVAYALVTNLADSTNAATTFASRINQSIDVSGARCLQTGDLCKGTASTGNHTNASTAVSVATSLGRTDANCPLSSVTLKNSTNTTIPSTAYNLSYTSTTGTVNINLANSTQLQAGSSSNTTWIDYSFCPTGYVVDGNSRTLIGLLVLFFVIAIFTVGVLYVKKMGLFDHFK
jgi:hypothetical protein